MLQDGRLSFTDGLLLLSFLTAFLAFTFKESKNKSHHEFDDLSKKVKKDQSKKTWLMLIVSLAVLISSAKLVVYGGVEIAKFFQISDLIIGLTVVALGTSLPELAVSITSVLKKQYEMVVVILLALICLTHLLYWPSLHLSILLMCPQML